MGAFGENPIFVQHQDTVHVLQGREPMRDHKQGLSVSALREHLENGSFGKAVEGGCGLVEDQDVRVPDQGPGNGEALLLPLRQIHPLFADDCVIPVRQPMNEPVYAGRPGCPLDILLACALVSVTEVLHDSPRQRSVLWDTNPIRPRRDLTSYSKDGLPSYRIRPPVGL